MASAVRGRLWAAPLRLVAAILLLVCAFIPLSVAQSNTAYNSSMCGPIPTASSIPRVNQRAVLVGINDYLDPTVPNLLGTHNDVCAMRNALVQRLSYDDENIEILFDQSATKSGILNALSPSRIAPPGTEGVFFYYAGHGSQLLDQNGDEAGSDGKDETLVAYDTQLFLRNDILDDELNVLFEAIAKRVPAVTVLLDACHSATALRSGVGKRGIERSLAAPSEIARVDAPDTDWQLAFDDLFGQAENITVLTAASERQEALEVYIGDGVVRGAFTYGFVNALMRSNRNLTSRELVDSARLLLAERGITTQTPTVEGRFADRLFLSNEDTPTTTMLAVPTTEQMSSVFQIPTGLILGETLGSVYILSAVTGEPFSVEAIVTQVGSHSANVTVQGAAIAAQAMRAELQLRAFPYAEPTVALLPNFEGPVEAYEALYEETIQAFEIASRRDWLVLDRPVAQYYLRLHTDENTVSIYASSGRTIEAEIKLEDVVIAIERWERWHQVAAIKDDRLQPLINASLVGPPCQFYARYVPPSWRRMTCVKENAPGPSLRVRNTSSEPVWINIIALNPSGSIVRLGEAREIAPGRSFASGRFNVRAPSGETETTLIKVFASKTYVDLAAFQQSAVRGDSEGCDTVSIDTLNHLLCAATQKRRDSTQLRIDEWSVTDLTIEVHPNE